MRKDECTFFDGRRALVCIRFLEGVRARSALHKPSARHRRIGKRYCADIDRRTVGRLNRRRRRFVIACSRRDYADAGDLSRILVKKRNCRRPASRACDRHLCRTYVFSLIGKESLLRRQSDRRNYLSDRSLERRGPRHRRRCRCRESHTALLDEHFLRRKHIIVEICMCYFDIAAVHAHYKRNIRFF